MSVFCVICKGLLVAIFEKREDAREYIKKECSDPDVYYDPKDYWIEMWNVQ